MFTDDEVADVVAAVNDLLALIDEGDCYNDVRMDKARAAVARLDGKVAEGMVSLEAVEEAINEVVAEHGKPQWYESRDDFVEDIMRRLNGS